MNWPGASAAAARGSLLHRRRDPAPYLYLDISICSSSRRRICVCRH